MQTHPSLLRSAIQASIPALFGYVSLGLSFGFLFHKMGAVWYLPPLMSLFVYAGAAQFIAITLLARHCPLIQILTTTFIINLRHIFYGISFLGKFPKQFFVKFYMIFALTDETYSILVNKQEKKLPDYSLLLMVLCHAYWVIGSLAGALLGSILTINLNFLEFSLTALFIVLAIEQGYAIKKFYPFIVAGLASWLALRFFPNEMLIVSMTLCAIFFIADYLMRVKSHAY